MIAFDKEVQDIMEVYSGSAVQEMILQGREKVKRTLRYQDILKNGIDENLFSKDVQELKREVKVLE